jgi:hypothetical protein
VTVTIVIDEGKELLVSLLLIIDVVSLLVIELMILEVILSLLLTKDVFDVVTLEMDVVVLLGGELEDELKLVEKQLDNVNVARAARRIGKNLFIWMPPFWACGFRQYMWATYKFNVCLTI